MSRSLSRLFDIAATASACALFATIAFGQSDSTPRENNPFAPSPKARTKANSPSVKAVFIEAAATVSKVERRETPDPARSTARETESLPDRAENARTSPTSIYRVGVGDVLAINIQNAAASSGVYTVRTDGTIDFPLAGENVNVGGRSVDDIEGALTASVKLFKTPQISVAVREYVSHGVLVNGLVEMPGYHQIQRDAVPLYVLRATAIIDPRANSVTIKRESDLKIETLLLANPNTDSALIYPGDSVEFTGRSDTATIGYYFIGGDNSIGTRRELSLGMTLSQAILVSGSTRSNIKRALIRRRNDSGMLVTTEYEVKGLSSGKLPDPKLNQGDIIELGR